MASIYLKANNFPNEKSNYNLLHEVLNEEDSLTADWKAAIYVATNMRMNT